MLVRDKPPRFTVFGTNGSFTKYGLDVQEQQLKQGISPKSPAYGKDAPGNFGTLDSEVSSGIHVKGVVTTVDGNYQAYYDNVAAAVVGDADLMVTAQQAANVIRIIELAIQSSFVNPFLPFDTRLFVKSLGSSHNLLLNKYCVVPYHLLITTASYEQQGEPLTEKDFSAVLDTTNNMSRQHIVFYNSGEESGASQPHKHLQLLPMPEYLDLPPLLGRWLDDNPLPGTMHTAKSLPFANFGVWLGTGPPTPSTLLAAYCSALKALTDRYGQNASYNMILVANTLVLFPRHHSRWHGIGVNSLGYSGLFLCKSNEEMALIENVGVLSILTSVGFPVTLLQKS
ncbi:bifunctional AP-4-A phosphorylase/ADP sulfurylase [Coemansia sp. RSA 1939]|nr:bifunctional AP-4-A phosphorylase/ADP sulfurylase [Coemansia sp. RSA 1939]KAJ2610159.1 bifunctional AP-4-A phosphorylase/ADP sulfurylase [Coemansia sp. RSA 1804]KAJ2694348.1 bifunctional AP-4-A phosphorylase/ADP sulfurylase [Coemansia sp. RSA 1285]